MLLLAILAVADMAGAPPRVFSVLSYGVGQTPCVTWLASDPLLKAKGESWVEGYWTGVNDSVPAFVAVGASTDAAGVVAEVRKSCEATPKQTLVEATSAVFIRMKAEGR